MRTKEHTLAEAPHNNVSGKLESLPPGSARVGGIIGRHIKKTIENNLAVLNIDEDFLEPFRQKKVDSSLYIGLGKLIDASAHFAAHSGSRKAEQIKNYLVEEVRKCQLPDGYTGAFVKSKRLCRLWDLHEISYIIQGLTSDYNLFGAEASLEAACLAADYVMKNLNAGNEYYPNQTFRNTTLSALGIEKGFLGLYEATRKREYLDFCVNERGLKDWNQDIVLGRHGNIEGHAYAYLAKCIAQLELFRLKGEPGLLKQVNRVLRFWREGEGMLITGACGQNECWHNTQDGAGDTGETCAGAYSVMLLDNLLRLKGESFYGDMMERIIYNALFSAQSPGGRNIRYYTPFEGERSYFKSDTYCCPNNYRRIMAMLPGMVCYSSEKAVVINLYACSSAEVRIFEGMPVLVEQRTDYPDAGDVAVMLTPSRPSVFSLKLRIPGWASGTKVTINGSAVRKTVSPGSFLNLRRRWMSGDEVRINMPMPWRLVKGRVNQAGRAAVMRGPVVFCLNPSLNRQIKGADPRQIVIDPDTVSNGGPRECRLRCWLPGSNLLNSPDSSLILKAFSDPSGEMTYFRLADPGKGENDELFAG